MLTPLASGAENVGNLPEMTNCFAGESDTEKVRECMPKFSDWRRGRLIAIDFGREPFDLFVGDTFARFACRVVGIRQRPGTQTVDFVRIEPHEMAKTTNIHTNSFLIRQPHFDHRTFAQWATGTALPFATNRVEPQRVDRFRSKRPAKKLDRHCAAAAISTAPENPVLRFGFFQGQLATRTDEVGGSRHAIRHGSSSEIQPPISREI